MGSHMLTLDIVSSSLYPRVCVCVCVCAVPLSSHSHPPHQNINFGLTRAFLDLVCSYLSLMVIMSRIEERRTIAVVYCTAYELDKGTRSARIDQ